LKFGFVDGVGLGDDRDDVDLNLEREFHSERFTKTTCGSNKLLEVWFSTFFCPADL
jgi:hypothetical protein